MMSKPLTICFFYHGNFIMLLIYYFLYMCNFVYLIFSKKKKQIGFISQELLSSLPCSLLRSFYSITPHRYGYAQPARSVWGLLGNNSPSLDTTLDIMFYRTTIKLTIS